MKYSLKVYMTLLTTACTSGLLQAGQLSIPNTPLFIQQETPANVLFVMDDSGSMDWEVIAKPHWEACNYDPDMSYTQCNTTYQEDGIFHFSQKTTSGGKRFNSREIYYLFNLNNKYSFYNALDFPELINEDWRIINSNFNGMAYNPNVTYTPWLNYCDGTGVSGDPYVSCDNAKFDNANSNPHRDHPDYKTTVNLGNYSYNGKTVGLAYSVSVDDKKFSGNTPNRNNIASGSNNIIDPWDSNALIQFTGGTTISVTVRSTNAQAIQNTIQTTTLSSNSTCFDALGPQNLVQEIINGTRAITAANGPGCRTIANAQQNYANWFEYNRRRSLSTKAAVSYIITNFPGLYYGLSYINNGSNIANKLPGLNDDLTASNNILMRQYFVKQQEAVGTPLVSALNAAGRYYAGQLGTSPIKTSCQRNFSILMTDGYWNDTNLERPRLGDVDGDGYGSRYSTLSDVAYHYYKNDLLTNMANNVAPTKEDPNTMQHMNTMGIAFGATGNLIAGADGWPTPKMNINSNWGNPDCNDDCPAKINDLWHAAFNSKGQFFAANNFEDLQAGLSTSLQGILAAMLGSGSTSASSSSMLIDNTHIYQAQFKNTDWSGDLKALLIDSNGNINTAQPIWSAAAQLKNISPTNRVVYTYGNKRGVVFNWPVNYLSPTTSEIPLAQTNLLVSDISSASRATIGNERIRYLRGDQSKEIDKGGTYRNRSSIMGDVIHSGSVYVGPPKALYTDPYYLNFKNTYKNRTPMIFVGANDGMLHGFNANTGAEMVAYVPAHPAIWSNLQSLTKDSYTHRYFVDETPAVADYLPSGSTNWRTVLASGLGLGGQGVFALDITDGNFANSAADAASKVLWEFTDANDVDVGYTFGTPQIVRMYNKKWAVIFGNGYNSTTNQYPSGTTDSRVSTSGQAVLYILFIEGGTDGTWTVDTDYIKIPVGATGTKNGLSEPTAIDINGDFTVDYIYAGDLNGDMWRFDVRATTPTTWKTSAKISKLYSAGTSQPILNAPVVAPHPQGLDKGFLVYFGTGKFIETNDLNPASQSTQTMYAIWDKNGTTATSFSGKSTLLQQKILGTVDNYRAVSNNQINWTTQNGWYLDLTTGERATSKPILRNGRVIFTTTIPSGSNGEAQCSTFRATSWLMELDAKNGGRLAIPPFDVNGDVAFDSSDYIEFNEQQGSSTIKVKAPPAGVMSDVGVTAAPTVMTTQEGNSEVKVLSGTGGVSGVRENPGQNVSGRQTWQEVN
ncbi:MAG: PilC/PilY family type IV pilus protein [Gammaproteobacteria bacterium]